MSDAADHRQLAEAALEAAESMRLAQPVWALVPLFYSAMHLMHARFDEDQLPPDERHPERHRTQRDGSGATVRFGTSDVVTVRYASVSSAYRSLATAARAVRYTVLHLRDTSRLWDEYDKLAADSGARPSRRD